MLGQKMFIFVAGAILAVAGMATERAWMIYAAAAVLSIGVLLRFIVRPPRRDTAASHEDDDADLEDATGEADDDACDEEPPR